MSTRWWEDAECKEYGPDLFFFESGGDQIGRTKELRQICIACPVRTQCLAKAMEEEDRAGRHYRYGFRGGLTADERWALSKSGDEGAVARMVQLLGSNDEGAA